MNMVYPNDFKKIRDNNYKQVHNPNSKSKQSKFQSSISLLLNFIIVLSIVSFLNPLPQIKATNSSINLGTINSTPIVWPALGQAAINVDGFGVVAENSPGLVNVSVPSASTSKLFTALMIMKAHPLKPGDSGQTLTVTEQDIRVYQDYLDMGGSVFPVVAGQRITQLQALQALLLPSANNIADLLAVWSYGSVENYTKEANIYLKSKGLTNTFVDDASGFSPKTKTTASDLTKAMALVMDDDVLASIVSLPKVQINETQEIVNTNRILGQDGIIGGKTGNTDEAGSCYVFAAEYQPEGSNKVFIYGAVMAQSDIQSAMLMSKQLLAQAKQNLIATEVLNTGKPISNIDLPWGKSVKLIPASNKTILRWKSMPLVLKLSTQAFSASMDPSKSIGNVSSEANGQISEVLVYSNPPGPSIFWRVLGRYL